jgi:transcriptional regulator with XRE-family HTH domain
LHFLQANIGTILRYKRKTNNPSFPLSLKRGVCGVGRYEEKGAHPSADVLSKIANVLEVSSDYLMNGTPDDLANSSLSDKELLNQFKIIEKLPEQDRNVVKIFLDAFILLQRTN